MVPPSLWMFLTVSIKKLSLVTFFLIGFRWYVGNDETSNHGLYIRSVERGQIRIPSRWEYWDNGAWQKNPPLIVTADIINNVVDIPTEKAKKNTSDKTNFFNTIFSSNNLLPKSEFMRIKI